MGAPREEIEKELKACIKIKWQRTFQIWTSEFLKLIGLQTIQSKYTFSMIHYNKAVKKLKTELPKYPVTPFLGIYPKK